MIGRFYGVAHTTHDLHEVGAPKSCGDPRLVENVKSNYIPPMDTALHWGTVVLGVATAGLLISMIITAKELAKQLIPKDAKNLLQITTRDGHLVEIINLDKIDQEDPEKIKRVLDEVKRANRETLAH
jgi:hypothetical protein